jgi:oxygen-independent coproporphyrinogen-3 oxidase
MINDTNEKNIIITSNNQSFELEIYHLAKMFFPTEKLEINFNQSQNQNQVTTTIEAKTQEQSLNRTQNDTLEETIENTEKKCKKFGKQALYKILSELSKKTLDWGILTGIRPTQLARDLISQGVDVTVIKEYLIKHFYLSQQKANLVYQTLKNQKTIIRNNNLINLYINIPVCPSRCNYCSFISSELATCKHILQDYLHALKKEIEAVKTIIFEKSLVVRTIYIGGGTPSVLSAEQLDDLLSLLAYPVSEFTVECGRADTINEEKLLVLKKHNVTRICINPQTFVQKTLKKIGRTHTNAQVFDAYMLALKYDFVVNMDFIAGLEDETLSNFKKTISTALELSPHNITIHTLFLKNSSQLQNHNKILEGDEIVKKMIDFSQTTLMNAGYKPYYLYRQKNQIGGLENVGWALDGKVSLFNIDSMEETLSVIACGAGAISKRIVSGKKNVERQANPKFLKDYIEKLDEVIKSKKNCFN